MVRTVDDPDGNGTIRVYEWDRENRDGGLTAIATGATLTLTQDLLGLKIGADVHYTDGNGNMVEVMAPLVGPVMTPLPHVNFTGVAGSARASLDPASTDGTHEVNEKAGFIWVELELSENAEFATSVHVREGRSGTTATPGSDYPAGPYSVTVPAGRTSAAFTIRTLDDEDLEAASESFRVRIDDASLPAGFVTPDGTGTPEEARVDIMENEYTFCFDQRSYSINEGGEAVMGLTFSVPLPEGGWFKFLYANRNAGDSDYTKVNAYPDVFWLPAGTEEYTLRVPAAADNLFEDNELVHVTADVPALPADTTNARSTSSSRTPPPRWISRRRRTRPTRGGTRRWGSGWWNGEPTTSCSSASR